MLYEVITILDFHSTYSFVKCWVQLCFRSRSVETVFKKIRSKYETSAYDGILLDVPCSSERHVLSSPPHLAAWSPARIKNLAYRQWALLSGAWLVLKPGGYLVYSTCALSPAENDDVVQKLFQKYDDAIRIESESLGERTQWGVHILPDAAEGAGPIYYAILGKAEKS